MKVFVSSTSKDLIPFRQAARDAILAQGWLPDMMEYAGTDPSASVLDSCARHVEACDLVLAILGWKQGSLPPGPDGWQSYTAWEITSARQLNKPLMVFLAEKDGWPQELQEENPQILARVDSFRRELDRRAAFFRWETPQAQGPELLPIFQLTVRQELVRYQIDLLSQDMRSSWKALRTAWARQEEAVLESIKERDLEGRKSLSVADDEIDHLWRSSLLDRKPWHEEIRGRAAELGRLTSPGPRSARMIQLLGALDFDGNYLALCKKIRDLLNREVKEEIQDAIRKSQVEIKNQRRQQEPADLFAWNRKLHNDTRARDLIYQLEDLVTQPTFRRCLLLSGSIGAGKTHRAAYFDPGPNRPAVTDAGAEEVPAAPLPAQGPFDAPWRCLILWLEQGAVVRTLEEEIADGLRKMTGRSWASPEEIDQALQRAAGQIAGKPGAPRLIIVLQDLHRRIRARPGFLDELARMLDRTTQLHSFFWVLTIQDTAYDRITGETLDELWRSMSVTPAPRPRMLSGRARRLDLDMTDREGLLGSWVDLDEVNRRENLGLRLIAQEMPESPVEPLALEEHPRQLANPQLAWILLDCRDQLSPDRAINLHFIGFIERFWRLRWQRLEASAAGDGKAPSAAQVEQVLALLARAMLEQADLYPEKEGLIERAAAQGDQLLHRNLRPQITNGLDLLEAAGLLTVETVEGGPLRREERVALRALFFWYFQLAQELFSVLDRLSGAELDGWLARLPEQCARFSEEDREGTLELLLLHSDDQRRDDSARAERTLALWRCVLETPGLPQAAVWLAAAKGSVWAQQLAAGFARDRRIRGGERRTLFGFLYFLSEVTCLSSPERAALLQPLFGKVREAHLQGYCRYVLRRILDAAANQDEWVAAASALAGCEVLDQERDPARQEEERNTTYTEEIGRMALRRAAELTADDTQKLLRLLVRYLRTEQPEVRGDTVIKPWRRHFIREWILFSGFDVLSSWKQQERVGPAALFKELAEFGWYEPTQLQMSRRVGREMEQEANIALGRWYRQWAWPKEREELERVIWELVNSRSSRDRQLAFFVMRHTGRLDAKGRMIIPAEFLGNLEQIARDPRLAWLREREPFRTELLRDLPTAPAESRQGRKGTR